MLLTDFLNNLGSHTVGICWQFLTSSSIEDISDWSYLAGLKGCVTNVISLYLIAEICCLLNLLGHQEKVAVCYLPGLWKRRLSILLVKWRINYPQSVISHGYVSRFTKYRISQWTASKRSPNLRKSDYSTFVPPFMST